MSQNDKSAADLDLPWGETMALRAVEGDSTDSVLMSTGCCEEAHDVVMTVRDKLRRYGIYMHTEIVGGRMLTKFVNAGITRHNCLAMIKLIADAFREELIKLWRQPVWLPA